MRILWIKTELLHPVDKGGRIRTYQMLRALREDHDVTYLTLDDGTAAPDAIGKSCEYASRVITVPFKPAERLSVSFFLELLENLGSNLPYAVQRYRSGALRARVIELSKSADLVICDFLAPSQNVPDGILIPTVLFQHNVEAKIWERHADVARDPLRRAYMTRQWRRMLKFEASECRRFDHVVAVSDSDAKIMRDEYGVPSVTYVATGVDTDYFAPSKECRSESEIVFVGTMDWMPNDDGVQWFISEVLPLVRNAISGVQLTIAGRRPSATLARLAARAGGVEVTGTVPDVRPYLARAALSIVPLRIGGGTRLKIYEAMAMGTPVVSTTIGAEGLPVRHAEHLLIADSPQDQADAIVQLLRDRVHAAEIAATALAYVRQNCSWTAVAKQFIADCRNAPRDRLSQQGTRS